MPETPTPETSTLETSDTLKKRFHDMVDTLLEQSNATAYIFHMAALCPQGIIQGSVAHGILREQDIITIFASGGARMLEELRSQPAIAHQTPEITQ